jgi:hypothetical protein
MAMLIMVMAVAIANDDDNGDDGYGGDCGGEVVVPVIRWSAEHEQTTRQLPVLKQRANLLRPNED